MPRASRTSTTLPGVIAEVLAGEGLGLSAVARKVPGHRGTVTVNMSTLFRWITAGASAADGTVVKLEAARIGNRWMTSATALAAFAAHADPDGRKALVLAVDNAGWHTTKRLPVPANVQLHFLPPCTPELQPVEPFWSLVREAVANDTFSRPTSADGWPAAASGWPRIR
jgi:hypothetical protein